MYSRLFQLSFCFVFSCDFKKKTKVEIYGKERWLFCYFMEMNLNESNSMMNLDGESETERKRKENVCVCVFERYQGKFC